MLDVDYSTPPIVAVCLVCLGIISHFDALESLTTLAASELTIITAMDIEILTFADSQIM